MSQTFHSDWRSTYTFRRKFFRKVIQIRCGGNLLSFTIDSKYYANNCICILKWRCIYMDIFTIYLIRMELFGLMEFIIFMFFFIPYRSIFASFVSCFVFAKSHGLCRKITLSCILFHVFFSFFILLSLMSTTKWYIQWSFIWKMVYVSKGCRKTPLEIYYESEARRLPCKKEFLGN